MLVLLAACQPALNWREVRPAQSNAVALFPCKPEVEQRPGMGLAYTDGKAGLPPANASNLTPEERARRTELYYTRIDFGSKVLFEPELALGYDINDKWSTELSYTHLSNGQIFHQGKNQGLDDVGVRLVYKF